MSVFPTKPSKMIMTSATAYPRHLDYMLILEQKLMVNTRFRKMGVARRIMAKLEEVAREKHRELLVNL